MKIRKFILRSTGFYAAIHVLFSLIHTHTHNINMFNSVKECMQKMRKQNRKDGSTHTERDYEMPHDFPVVVRSTVYR